MSLVLPTLFFLHVPEQVARRSYRQVLNSDKPFAVTVVKTSTSPMDLTAEEIVAKVAEIDEAVVKVAIPVTLVIPVVQTVKNRGDNKRCSKVRLKYCGCIECLPLP